MPCWEVNTVSLKLVAKNTEMIMEVLDSLDYAPNLSSNKRFIYSRIGTFDLEAGKVETESYNSGRVNEVRKKYSEAALMKAAKKNKWVVKRRSPNQYVAKKW